MTEKIIRAAAVQFNHRASDMVSADLDLEKLTNCKGRRKLRARRPELYGPLTVPTGKEVDPIKARFSTE